MANTAETSVTLYAGSNPEIALGLPGQQDGRPTQQTDRGDETQLQFSYQCVAGVVFLCAAVAGVNDYRAIWVEHHDDILAQCGGDQFDAIQSKTSVNAGVYWYCSDGGFVDAVRKFCSHQKQHAERVRNFIFFSNIKPYVPAASTKKPASLARSPMRLVDECKRRATCSDIEEPYRTAFMSLCAVVNENPKVVLRVVQKLLFVRGPPMEAFGDQLPMLVAAVPDCARLPMPRLREAGQNLYNRLHAASTLNTSLLALQASPAGQDGRAEAAIRAKMISTEDARQILLRHPGESFLFDNHGLLNLGKIRGQKEVLRSKMKVGGVGQYFNSMWFQAIGAENRLMAEANVDPRRALQRLGQLEAVVLIECQNAEADASLEPEEGRGLKILNRILARTEELSRTDSEQVLNERPETLRGMAGLLSGSCHFAWGKPLPDDKEVPNGV